MMYYGSWASPFQLGHFATPPCFALDSGGELVRLALSSRGVSLADFGASPYQLVAPLYPAVLRARFRAEPFISLGGFALSAPSQINFLTCKHDANLFAPCLARLIADPQIVPCTGRSRRLFSA